MDNFNMNSSESRKSQTFLPRNNLYHGSHFNDINWDIFSESFDHHDVQLSDSSYFNYIDWDLFKLKPDAECHGKSSNALLMKLPYMHLLMGYSGQQNHERFNDVFKYKIWNYETNTPVKPLFEDEGFSTPGSNFSEELEERHDHFNSEIHCSAVNLEIAERARSVRKQNGRQWTVQEPKFASEHDASILHLWKIWNFTRPLSHPTSIGLQINFEEFKIDINYLMFGVASNSFYFAPITKTFHIREKLHLPTVTPEALASFCAKFLECGNSFRALGNFITTKSKIGECGPIHQTFCNCVKNVLQMHRCGLLNLEWEHIHTLSQLEILASSFRRKISFTKDLCAMCAEDENHENILPHGVLLLDRLYASLAHIETSDLKFLMLYFFESCCNIYLKIVSEWLFNGCFSNSTNYDEFFVKIQHELEVCWDWRRLGYVRVNEKQIPQCLRKFFKDIFACGKSVNLLRIFSKKEIFEQILPKTYPAIRCCFNSAQIEAYTSEWKQFQDNFYKKRNWRIRLKDRLIQNYNVNFQNMVKETRRKWFEDFETRQQETAGNSTNTSKISRNCDEELLMIPSSKSDREIQVAELDSCTATDSSDFPIVEKRSDLNEPVSLRVVAEFGDGLPDKTLSSKCTDGHYPEVESTPTVIVPSSVCKGAGDSETPVKCTSLSSKSLTEYQRNRRNSLSSSTHIQSCAIFFPQAHNKFSSTPVGACAQNRLKNMSTTFNNDPVGSINHESTPADIVSSSVCKGAGDSETPVRCTSLSSRSLTEYQRNRRNSMSSSSSTHIQSSAISFPQAYNKFSSTPVGACAQNRLKNMSTTFNNDPVESINHNIVTPMSDLVRNRMNVMRSEYYERLSYTNPSPSKRPADRKPFVESECAKNKLKVMTSEYHVRLNALDIQEMAINSKLSNESKAGKLTEREMNEELHQHLQANTDENSVVRTVDSATKPENFITDIGEDANLVNDCAISTVSEDGEAGSMSENLVTIIENVENTDVTNESSVPVVQSMIDGISFSKFSNIFPKLVTQNTSQLFASAHSVEDVDITSVLYYLSPSISIPLRIQSKLANEAILWVFIEQEGYLEHLKTLKNYVLLRKAEFSLSMTNSLFEMCEDVKSPSLLLNSYTLNSILQRALSACNSENLAKFERNLSFTLEEPIPDFFNLTDTQMLRCLSMHYTVKWPVNVLITEPIIEKYSRIFRFLIQLQRVSWVLKADFKDMKNFKQGKSIQFTQVQLFRHTMTQVIRLLKEYIMREALEQCWSDLVHNLTNSEINLDELYMLHLKYINKIIQRCFLCEDSVTCHKAILLIFGSVLQCHNVLRKGSWHRNEEFNLLYHTNFKNLRVAYQEFGKNLDNFRTVLKTLVYQKQKTYFEPLFLQLNNNTKNETEL